MHSHNCILIAFDMHERKKTHEFSIGIDVISKCTVVWRTVLRSNFPNYPPKSRTIQRILIFQKEIFHYLKLWISTKWNKWCFECWKKCFINFDENSNLLFEYKILNWFYFMSSSFLACLKFNAKYFEKKAAYWFKFKLGITVHNFPVHPWPIPFSFLLPLFLSRHCYTVPYSAYIHITLVPKI